jgi:hypothetical protein
MPARSNGRNEKSLRGLLFLFAVFVFIAIIAAVITATKKPTSSAALKSNPGVAANTTTTAAGGKVHTSPPPITVTSTTGAATKPTPTTARPTPTTKATTTTMSTTYVLYNVGGSASNTLGFTVIPSAGEWDVAWADNCGKTARFGYTVKRAALLDARDRGPHEVGTSSSGLDRYHDTGTLSLSIVSQCQWTIKITEVIYG